MSILFVRVVAAVIGVVAHPLNRYTLAVATAELRLVQTATTIVLVVVMWTVRMTVASVDKKKEELIYCNFESKHPD